MDFKFEGLVAAPFTPMKENGDIDLSKIPEYAQHLAKGGVGKYYFHEPNKCTFTFVKGCESFYHCMSELGFSIHGPIVKSSLSKVIFI